MLPVFDQLVTDIVQCITVKLWKYTAALKAAAGKIDLVLELSPISNCYGG
jgi:hypothetical protein